MKKTLVLLLASTLMACPSKKETAIDLTQPTTQEKSQSQACVVAGCSQELCVTEAAAADLMSTCQWQEEFACRQKMTCERQADGQCGFTATPESEQCMKELSKKPAI